MARVDVIRKVQALLDKAAATGFTAEAESFRAKADEMMTKFIIEEHELREAGSVADREAPSVRRIPNVAGPASPIKEQVSDLASYVATYCGVRITYFGLNQARYGLSLNVYGFASEVDYFEVLLTSLMVQMANDMEPKYDPEADAMTNLDTLRSAGLGWARVFEIMAANGVSKSQASSLRQVWLRRNPENRNLMPATYLRSFASGFVHRVGFRLYELKQTRSASLSTSNALVLVDRSSEVDSFFKEATEGIKAHKPREQRLVGSGISRGREAGNRADLGGSQVASPRTPQIGA